MIHVRGHWCWAPHRGETGTRYYVPDHVRRSPIRRRVNHCSECEAPGHNSRACPTLGPVSPRNAYHRDYKRRRKSA